ncbi:succinate-semialdehyde dehydrogenase/glutarate-semialdehyde dehydrogenase [Aminobacter niigataensis]|uniref:Succinate-semialdehyde dehydrogenase/glutarate-semialdehyde dehydrogenase n=1 Tax=Aminobacter niigataensis TaxID=83265 RepID=A0ABR6L3H8_9HYPH|nr:NAD-dependent succinate-semialdehyde dehydrogenase [Aminobacter niigataensis]MBB4651295.1 succinate-semialdehyde dehydrogenase/glutarate-semialdehyde dehydrogenase [Aminobacter niigataensis]
MYPDVKLFIDGKWTAAEGGNTIDVYNPATNEVIGKVASAGKGDLDRALAAAERGFKAWRKVSPFDRAKVLRRAAELMRERVDQIATLMTQEQGKPIGEARMEILSSADLFDWFAEEGRRTYGRVIPARAPGVQQLVVKEPVGPVAAFTPWNFPVSQAVRKIGAALATGCSIIVKPPEETPASPACLADVFKDAGLPDGVLNLVYGNPPEISSYLVPHPIIRKVSFTGSVPVGKHLAALAGTHMKRATMELGGHAPAMVFDDADIDAAAAILAGSKFRNAGQVCVSPTRFLIQEGSHDRFLGKFVEHVRAVKVGDGLAEGTRMGPLVNERRLEAVEKLINEAVSDGARIETGGKRIGNKGSYFEPTVLSAVRPDMRIMNEEPFGPVALVMPFKTFEDVVAEANRLPYGLAAYAFTKSNKTVTDLGSEIETGMLTINHLGLALPETPFGGIKDSGYGSEGGSEALEAYLVTKFLTQVAV